LSQAESQNHVDNSSLHLVGLPLPLEDNIIEGIRENFGVIDEPIVTGGIIVDIAPRSGRKS